MADINPTPETEAAVQSVPDAPEVAEEHSPASHIHHIPDVTEIPGIGRVPLNIYTVIFVVLAVLTLAEVALGTTLEGAFIVLLLASIALAKATLVVAYYMHLKTDDRIFRYVLLIPLFIGIAGILWLMVVKPTGY